MTLSGTEDRARSDEPRVVRVEVSRGLNIFEPDSDLLGAVEQLRRTKYLPEEIIDAYVREALKLAQTSQLEDGTVFAEIPGFPGVWANNADVAACYVELRDVLFDWLVIKIEKDDRNIPVLTSLPQINLNVIGKLIAKGEPPPNPEG